MKRRTTPLIAFVLSAYMRNGLTNMTIRSELGNNHETGKLVSVFLLVSAALDPAWYVRVRSTIISRFDNRIAASLKTLLLPNGRSAPSS
jgi:hypothetical protein